jgi:hypothetical protein
MGHDGTLWDEHRGRGGWSAESIGRGTWICLKPTPISTSSLKDAPISAYPHAKTARGRGPSGMRWDGWGVQTVGNPVNRDIARDRKTKSRTAEARRRGDAENNEGREAEKQVSPLINTDDTDRNGLGKAAKRRGSKEIGKSTNFRAKPPGPQTSQYSRRWFPDPR